MNSDSLMHLLGAVDHKTVACATVGEPTFNKMHCNFFLSLVVLRGTKQDFCVYKLEIDPLLIVAAALFLCLYSEKNRTRSPAVGKLLPMSCNTSPPRIQPS